MPTLDIIQALVVLLPGFVTTGVIRALFVGETENDFDKVVKSLIYALINYAIYAALLGIWFFFKFHSGGAVPISSNLQDLAPKSPLQLVWLVLISVAVGCIVARYKNNDGHGFLLRPLRITFRSARPSIWHDSFVEGTKYHVIVTLEDERRIIGWPVRYSDDVANPSVFLVDAAWLDEQGQETAVGNEGILILAPMKIASVEFLRSEEKTSPSNSQLKSDER